MKKLLFALAGILMGVFFQYATWHDIFKYLKKKAMTVHYDDP